MATTTTVFAVDDDPGACESVSALVESMGLACQAFASAEEILASGPLQGPGCIVTELRMCGMSGLELQERLSGQGVRLPVILITAYAETSATVKAMKNGAVTLLEKPCSKNALWDAICEALRRDAELRERDERLNVVAQRLEALTPQERSVLEMMIDGKLNKLIAREMECSERTVEARRRSIFDKLQTKSLAELVRMVVELRLHQQSQDRRG